MGAIGSSARGAAPKMPLTDFLVRSARPAAGPLRLYDERGPYLEIAPNGGRWWRLKYRFDGKKQRLSLGVYPDVSLRRDADR